MRLDLILSMRVIYINSKLNPLTNVNSIMCFTITILIFISMIRGENLK